MKQLKTVLLTLSIAFGWMVYITRDPELNSLSAHAITANNVFYNLMHLCASWFFLLNARYKRYATEYILALGMGLILAFDMYKHTTFHNLFTLLTLLLASFTLLWNRKDTLDKWFGISCVAGATGVFALGYFTDIIYFLVAEIWAMTFIAVGKLKEIHGKTVSVV